MFGLKSRKDAPAEPQAVETISTAAEFIRRVESAARKWDFPSLPQETLFEFLLNVGGPALGGEAQRVIEEELRDAKPNIEKFRHEEDGRDILPLCVIHNLRIARGLLALKHSPLAHMTRAFVLCKMFDGMPAAAAVVEFAINFCRVNLDALDAYAAYEFAVNFAKLREVPGLSRKEKALFRDGILRVSPNIAAATDQRGIRFQAALEIEEELLASK